jgi:nucleoside 2-deoxyribosyltransferase
VLNPKAKIVKSDGVDLPVMHVYLAGRISGDNIDLCLKWRQDIINHYKNYKGKGQYPISFLCPLNSGEANSIDAKGLTSSIPPNLIYDKDLLSVKTADVVVANLDDFFEEDIKDLLNIKDCIPEEYDNLESRKKDFFKLQEKILNRRENLGTVFEISWALLLNKPLILIVPKRRKEIYEKHPFTKRASVIVSSVDELLKEKYLQLLYKSISSAIY